MTLAQLFDAQRTRDPTQTIKLRKAFRATAKLQLRQLRATMRVAVIDHNVLGYGQPLAYVPADVRLRGFTAWLTGVGEQFMLGREWARPYIERAWALGQSRAMREIGKGPGEDRSEAIVALARVEIEGILGATLQRVSRIAARVIARGARRYDAIRQLLVEFDKVAQPRLVVMCDVLAIKAYNEAKLSVYAAGGIKRVGVQAETLPHARTHRMDAADRAETPEEISAEEEQLVGILTAGDNKVCELCEDWAEDAPYEIEEVRDVYPLHPRCRCAVFPWEDLRFKGEDAFDDYDPNQPRDPAGTSTGGQWTGSGWGGASHGEVVSEKQTAAVKALAETTPGLKGMLAYLAPDEINRVKKVNVKKMVQMFTEFPVEAEEMAAVAFSGEAKRGWYRKSAKALVEVFGLVDAPRFAALMAALSPQTGVEDNAINALNTWVNWSKAGRPVDRDGIIRVLGESVQGEKGAESILPAWINNSVTALSTNSPEDIVLSGPKVDSFAQNLRDHVNAVTLDSWMANYIGVKQALFARRQPIPGKTPGKGPFYIATAAVTRKAAEILTEKTGTKWTPAEIQETIWSWAKTLYERATTDKTTVAQLLEAGSVTHKDIADTPDFAILFTQNIYRKILEAGGYGEQAAAIAAGNLEPDRLAGGRSSLLSAEGSGIAQDAFTRHLFKAAERLDKLRIERAKRKAEAAEEDGLDDYDPNEPRDPLGQWTAGGGTGRSPGAGYSATAYVDKAGVIHTTNVYDAQRALFENRRVELKQLKQLSTLIQRLGETAAEMAEHGHQAPVFNLCNVSVEGTNLFCSEHKGIPRVKMPVIPAKRTKEFVQHLKSLGYKTEKSTERADHLRATQDQIDGAKVAEKMGRIDAEGFYKRLVVSKDDYILDGHHTWAAQLGVDARDGTLKGDKHVKITRVNIPIIKLIEEADKWMSGQGITKKAVGQDYDPDEPRVPAGETGGGRWTTGGGGEEIEHGMIEANARSFVEARDVSQRQQFLSAHPAEELGQHTLLLNREGNVGISVDPHGDIQNVFNNGGPKGGAAKAMVAAIEHGGHTLDCYDGFLPGYYGQFGFKEVQRMHFNPQFAPQGWDFAKYDNPDIVFMAWSGYDKGGAKGAVERASSRKNWNAVERTKHYGDDWDAAKDASRAAARGGGARNPRPAESDPGPRSDAAGDRAGTGAGASARGNLDAYDPNQPRDPAGSPTGGQWTSGGAAAETVHEGLRLKVCPVGKGKAERAGLNPRYSGRAKAMQKLAAESGRLAPEPKWHFSVEHATDPYSMRSFKYSHSGGAQSRQEATESARRMAEHMITTHGPPHEASEPPVSDKPLFVSHSPHPEVYDKWFAQLKTISDKAEAEQRIGDRVDTQVHYMRNALKEYRDATDEQKATDKIALSAVYSYGKEDTESTLLATTLVRFSEIQKVARVTLSGGLDAAAHTKSLEQIVKQFGGRAQRIEGQFWGDDLETALIYEHAGFRIAGETSTGMTRAIYGSEEQTAEEKKDLAERAAKLDQARKEKNIEFAREAARKCDFNPGLITFSEEDKTFKVGSSDKLYHFAGSYQRGQPGVVLYHPNVQPWFVAGVTAHEIGHRKLDALRARYRDEYRDMLKEPGPAPDPTSEHWWQKRGGHDAVMRPDGSLWPPYAEKYPVYQAWTQLMELQRDKMIESDGVSDYSRDYWNAYGKGEISIDKPIHETIAELSRIQLETGKLKGSKEWNQLFRLVDKNWAGMNKIEREMTQHSGEKEWW